MVQVLSEKSLLVSAESAWSEIENFVDQRWYQAFGGTDGHRDAKLTGRPELGPKHGCFRLGPQEQR